MSFFKHDVHLKMIRFREISKTETEIKRIFFSGSSGSGKTSLAKSLIQDNFFGSKTERIYYYHPDFHETDPIENWKDSITIPILCQGGLPTFNELIQLPPYSIVILDDLIQECVESKDIDYLMRVLSSKRKLHVILMSQRYFIGNKFGLSIRNSSNFHVLLRNSDERTNQRVGVLLNLKSEILTAEKLNKNKMYPHIFLDRSAEARVNNLQVFVNILGRYKQVVIGSMSYYLISDSDFDNVFRKIDSTHATIKYADKKQNLRRTEIDNADENDNSTRKTVQPVYRQSIIGKRRQLERTIKKLISQHKLSG